MKGFPKRINSKADLINLKDRYPEKVAKELNRLLSGRNRWLVTGVVPGGETGVNDSTHKVVSSDDGLDHAIKTQHEYKEDPNAELFRLGFTVAEAETLLSLFHE